MIYVSFLSYSRSTAQEMANKFTKQFRQYYTIVRGNTLKDDWKITNAFDPRISKETRDRLLKRMLP